MTKKNKIGWQDPAKDSMKDWVVVKTISAAEVIKAFEEEREYGRQQEIEEREVINSRPVTCPLCKHKDRFDKFYKSVNEDNDVCGPGYRSWSLLEYNCCPECGIMFQEKK